MRIFHIALVTTGLLVAGALAAGLGGSANGNTAGVVFWIMLAVLLVAATVLVRARRGPAASALHARARRRRRPG